MLKPLWMLFHPGMIGRALESNIQRDFEPNALSLCDQMPEILRRSEFGMDRRVTTCFRSNRPGTSNVTWLSSHRIVLALAKTLSDRMNWRQIHDVEAHVGYVSKPCFNIFKRPMFSRNRRARSRK